LSWRSTTPEVSIPRLLFWMALQFFYLVFCNTLVTLLRPPVAGIPPSALLSYPRKVSTSFPSGKQSLFQFIRFVWWLGVHRLLWLLFGFNIHKWNQGFITSYDVIRKFIAIFVVSL
jgi:hypothetical protein